MLNNVKVLYVLDFVAFKDFHVQHTGSSRGLTPPAIGGRIRRIGKKNEGKGFLNVAALPSADPGVCALKCFLHFDFFEGFYEVAFADVVVALYRQTAVVT